MDSDNHGSNPVSAKRQKILDVAFAQLRKSRAAMDPSLLKKIRRIIAGSPEMMKKLGVDETLAPDQDMPLSSKGAEKPRENQENRENLVQRAPTPQPSAAPKAKKEVKEGYEAIDQEKNMEIMAKLMNLNPDGRSKIKSVIEKAGKS